MQGIAKIKPLIAKILKSYPDLQLRYKSITYLQISIKFTGISQEIKILAILLNLVRMDKIKLSNYNIVPRIVLEQTNAT